MSYQYPQISMGSANKKHNAQLQNLLNEKMGAGLDVDGIFGAKTSQAVKNYQRQNGLQVDGIVGPKTWASLLASSNKSTLGNSTDHSNSRNNGMESAKEAYEELVGKNQFSFDNQAQLEQATKDYLQRPGFSYQLSTDPLYQHYAARYTQAGRQAMEDTMGQAATLTGGYGNSYAQTVGQQVYGGYLQQLNDRIPELYELALGKYEKEGERLRKRYELLQGLENQAYDRHQEKQKDAYDKEQDQKKEQQIKRSELVELIRLGYTPTARELVDAGMTQAQVYALMFGDDR